MPKLVDHTQVPRRPPTPSAGDPVLVDAIVAHLREHVGDPAAIARDPEDHYIRCDIAIIPREHDILLCTAGMAERRADDAVPLWTELVARLPATWPMDAASLALPQHRWPLAWLRYLARLPHVSGQPFDIGHSVGPMFRGSASPFNGAAFVESGEVPPLVVGEREITFLAFVPLYEAEAEAASREGASAILGGLAEHELVDITRAPLR